MSQLRTFTLWAFVCGVILFATLHPQAGVIFSNPLAALSLGIVGLGLCKHVHEGIVAQRDTQPAAAHANASNHSPKRGE